MLFYIQAKYGIIVNSASNMSDLLLNAINLLVPLKNDSIMLIPNQYIQGTHFLKVTIDEDSIYTLEIRKENSDSWKQYKYMTNNKNEVINFFNDYYFRTISPLLDKWIDVTYEVLNRHSISSLDKETMENARKLLNKTDSEIESDMYSFIIENANKTPGGFIVRNYFNELKELYLKYKGITSGNVYFLTSDEQFRLEKAYENANTKLDEEQDRKILSYIDECIIWGRNKKRITKGDIEMFFFEKNIKIPNSLYTTKDIFYRKVKERKENDF